MATIKTIIDLMSGSDVSVNSEIQFVMKGRDVTADSTIAINNVWDKRRGRSSPALVVSIADDHIEKLVQERVNEIFLRLAASALEEPKEKVEE